MDLTARYRRAADEFGSRVDAIADAQWSAPTPCAGWDVRALVNHLTGESLWAPHLLGGGTVAELGDRLEGDLLGGDPKGAFRGAADAALRAVEDAAPHDGTVHVSWGDIPMAQYVTQLASDRLIHAWDLARAIGADDHLDDELVAWAYDVHAPIEDELKATGLFGPRITPPPGADLQTRLLAVLGRHP